MPEDRREHAWSSGIRIVIGIVKLFIVACIIITPVRFFIAQPFIVAGASMEPTFNQGEYLVIDEISYRFETIKRGDVVVFRYPLDPSIFFVKRVIGLPGETVVIHNGMVSIGKPGEKVMQQLDETYLVNPNNKRGDFSIELESDEYFMLGDNRDASSDSRTWGPVKKRFVIGRAYARLLPLQNAAYLPGLHTFPEIK